ncbi:hypothetical protein BJV74DRAFT_819213 [Russula compacta]|nr:hypothetical protein BJV74DRAFT_819213 [Russula compacta]
MVSFRGSLGFFGRSFLAVPPANSVLHSTCHALTSASNCNFSSLCLIPLISFPMPPHPPFKENSLAFLLLVLLFDILEGLAHLPQLQILDNKLSIQANIDLCLVNICQKSKGFESPIGFWQGRGYFGHNNGVEGVIQWHSGSRHE